MTPGSSSCPLLRSLEREIQHVETHNSTLVGVLNKRRISASPHLDVASLPSMRLPPASRVEGGAASLGARAVPHSPSPSPSSSTSILLLIPAGVAGGCHRALSLSAPALHRLGACTEIKADGSCHAGARPQDFLFGAQRPEPRFHLKTTCNAA